LQFIEKKVLNPVTILNSVEEVEEFLAKNAEGVNVVLFGGNEVNMFTAFSVSYRFADFAFIDNEEANKHYKVKKGTVVLFKPFDERRNEIPGVYSIPTM